MNKLVSVLMCVYNTPLEYLKEAVDSILTQDYENIEFIIVDDHSTRVDILVYLNELVKHTTSTVNRIELIHNASNLGLTKSLNIGLEKCAGDYIARMDSDDLSLPYRIRYQEEFWKKIPMLH